MTTAPDAAETGVRGILAPVRFARMLQVVLLVLLAVCAARYVIRHEWDATAAMILSGVVVLAVIAVMQGLVPRHGAWPAVWTLIVCALWVALTLTAPSFAWCAVPLAFQVLQILPFWPASGVVSVMTAVVVAAELRLNPELDPTIFAGPIGIAVAAVVAYRALDREATARQRLVDELTEAQAELAAAEHRAGGLAERARLSREIHDSVGQNLTSINLLLQAAEQGWDRRPDAARAQVRTAADSARAGLDEVRRVVRDLAPAELDGAASSLPAAVQRAVQRAVADAASSILTVDLRVHGEVDRVPLPVASAVIRTVRGALANVAEHARATRAVVSLTAQPGELRLDIRDDGIGFDARPAARRQAAVQRRAQGRGYGLDGIAERIAVVGGHLDIESAPGEGTTLSAVFPLTERTLR
ncbi:sensor histidine kinase [Microbacterium esteraromaticum]|uniref:sensor histidine kinase n=1 Tax=Microbacterium esteraromaticum TaxID=57043 RepID=UPI0019575EC2|nr:sensor histidine kinase [Microbacterium esteraromaticum]MBM7466390.1 signal transduction histidine kinase [Microbacterium esteraromaticum]